MNSYYITCHRDMFNPDNFMPSYISSPVYHLNLIISVEWLSWCLNRRHFPPLCRSHKACWMTHKMPRVIMLPDWIKTFTDSHPHRSTLTPGFQKSSANTTRSALCSVRPILAAVMESTATQLCSENWNFSQSCWRSAEGVDPSIRIWLIPCGVEEKTKTFSTKQQAAIFKANIHSGYILDHTTVNYDPLTWVDKQRYKSTDTITPLVCGNYIKFQF